MSADVYSLDIETLIGVLQNRQIQGFFKADLSSGGAGQGTVVVEVREGKMNSVVIYAVDGRVLFQGKDALKRIRRVVLNWQLSDMSSTPSQRSTTMPLSPADTPAPFTQFSPGRPGPDERNQSSLLPAIQSPLYQLPLLVPVRQRQLPMEYWRYMSRTARSIYALVNGANSIERISHLLSLPANQVYAELVAMQREGLVTFIREA